MAGSGLSFFLFCGGEEDVVQDQTIPRAVGVEVQVCRRITNTVGVIFRVVAAVEGKRPLAIISIEIFYLLLSGRLPENDGTSFQFVLLTSGRLAVESGNTADVVLRHHRVLRIPFGRAFEKGEIVMPFTESFDCR